MAGRGRLTAFDLLPEEAAEDVVWAMRELAQRKRTQDDIRAEFNGRLAAKGIEPIKGTAFNRQALRVASAQRRMHDARAMFEGMAAHFNPADADRHTLQLGEFIKALITELVDDQAGEKSPKQAMELARAYQATVAAQKASTEHRQRLEAEMRAELAKVTDKAIDAVAKEKGLTGDTVRGIKERILGLKLPSKDAP